VSEALGVSRGTVDRDWAYARAWLCQALDGPNPPGEGEKNPADPGEFDEQTEH
jgi:hypothetical protein